MHIPPMHLPLIFIHQNIVKTSYAFNINLNIIQHPQILEDQFMKVCFRTA